jgi:DNA gyrase subunit A
VYVGSELPDLGGGLSELHREILVRMRGTDHGVADDFAKCVTVIGDLGLPQAEERVHETIVDLVRDFTTRYPLITGLGNFGSIDDDPAADALYTECRLSATGEAVAEGSFPNLLTNGAVGERTFIPPHNLGEVAAAIGLLLDDQQVPDERLLQGDRRTGFPHRGSDP